MQKQTQKKQIPTNKMLESENDCPTLRLLLVGVHLGPEKQQIKREDGFQKNPQRNKPNYHQSQLATK